MKIRVATIGTNFIVDSFVKGARFDDRFEYSVVYSRHEDTARAFASKHGAGRICTSLEELASASDVDAVYIASPNSLHAQQAIMMMNAGKHVLCEKPMAPSAAEVEAMIEASHRNGVALMEAMKSTLLPNFFSVRKALSQIGTVRRFSASFCQYSSRFDAFLAGTSVANVFNPDFKGGVLRDLGVYCIAPMVHLFGVPWEGEWTPSKASACVSATAMTFAPGGVSDVAKEIDVQGTMTVKYPQMDAILSYSKACDGPFGAEILGSAGAIMIDKISTMTSPRLRMRSGSGDAMFRGAASDIDLSAPTVDQMYHEIHEFFNLVSSGRLESTENTHALSLAVARIVDAAYNPLKL